MSLPFLPKRSLLVPGAKQVPSAFTLIELLVVIAIIAVLAAILLPVFGSVTRAKNSAVCMANLRQLAAATLAYCNDNNGYFPPQVSNPPYTTNGSSPWNQRIYKYLGLSSDQQGTALLKCPSDPRKYQLSATSHARSYSFSATSSFDGGGSAARNGLMSEANTDSRRVIQVSQPSQTLMITEWWTGPDGTTRANLQESYNYSVTTGWNPVSSVPKYTDGKTYYHGGGTGLNAVFVDGHAATVTPVQLVGDLSTKISPFTVFR